MALMGLITIYALLADDIRVLSTDKDGDQHFYGTYCFLLAIFGVEILISCFGNFFNLKRKYLSKKNKNFVFYMILNT